jgi:hypothetical protein
MKKVLDYIDERQAALPGHPLFGLLAADRPVEDLLPIVPTVAFWVMSFQDALRINARRISDRPLARVARHHLNEDAGHDVWYLSDLRQVTGVVPDLAALFAEPYRVCREVSYGLLAETFLAVDDAERIALLLVFESTGQVFFPRVVDCFRRGGIEPALQYFAQTHLDVEIGHEIAEERMHQMLGELAVPDQTVERCLAAVDRCYEAFSTLFDALVDSVGSADAGTVRQLRIRADELRRAATGSLPAVTRPA